MTMPEHEFQRRINSFIQLGNGSLSVSEISTDREFKSHLINCRKKWVSSSNQLPEVDLQHLIKGLVIYDGTYNSYPSMSLGGSVSPIIILCQSYAKRFSEKKTELMTWVIQHRANIYLPYGKAS